MYRAHREISGRAFPWMLIAVLIAGTFGAGVAYIFLRGDADGGDADAPAFAFRLQRVETVPVGEGADEERLERAANRVRGVLSRLYSMGFVDPEAWGGGEFPGLAEVFGGKAARRSSRDVGDLTLGSAAREMERVEPEPGRLRLSFLLGPDGGPLAAVARTTFRAEGTTRSGGAVRIAHGGRYLLRLLGDAGWRIVAYDVEGRMRERPRPAPTATGATP